MTQDRTAAYLRSKVFSATPEELRLLLLDGALRFARLGREGLANKNYEQSYTGLSSCKNILLELVSSLRPEINPELCSRLSGLYMFMYRRLVDANLEKNAAIVDEVIGLLEYERETWVMLMERLKEERGGGAPPAPESAPKAAPAARPSAGMSGALPTLDAAPNAGAERRVPLHVDA